LTTERTGDRDLLTAFMAALAAVYRISGAVADRWPRLEALAALVLVGAAPRSL
jgi:hypothetical protein